MPNFNITSVPGSINPEQSPGSSNQLTQAQILSQALSNTPLLRHPKVFQAGFTFTKMDSKPNLLRCIPGGLWLEGID